MDFGLTPVEIFFAFLALFFTALLGLFFNHMRLLIEKEKAAEKAPENGK